MKTFKHLLLVIVFMSFSFFSYADIIDFSWDVTSESTSKKFFTLNCEGSVKVNWGDGNITEYPVSGDKTKISHKYAYISDTVYSCVITALKITSLDIDSKKIKTLNVSNAPELTYLSASSGYLKDIDVSKNKKLETFYCSSNDLSSIDISNNVKLEKFNCDDNKLEFLDVSFLPELTSLNCSENKICTLDLETNTKLVSLNVSETCIKTLNLSFINSLKKLYCIGDTIENISICPKGDLSYISFENAAVSASKINDLIKSLPKLDNFPVSANLIFEGCANVENCDFSLAYNKNWRVDILQVNVTLSVQSEDVLSMDSICLKINVETDKNLSGFQFHMVVPEGFVVDTSLTDLVSEYSGNELIIKRSEKDTLDYFLLSFAPSSGNEFSSGTLMNVYLSPDSRIDEYSLKIRDAVFSDINGDAANVDIGETKFNVCAKKGDCNGDNYIDISDLVWLVDKICGNSTAGFQAKAGDIDNNGEYNVLDIVKLIILIDKEVPSGKKADFKNSVSVNLFSDVYTGSGNNLYLSEFDDNNLGLFLSNKDSIQAAQVDILLPSGFSFCKEAVSMSGRAASHKYSLEKISGNSNIYRLLLYPVSSGICFDGNSGMLANIKINKEPDASGESVFYMGNAIMTDFSMNKVSGNSYDVIYKSGPEGSCFKIFSGKGYIDASYEECVNKIVICNLSGNICSEIDCTSGSSQRIFLKSGIYLVSIYYGQGKRTIKTLVQ